MKKFEKNHLWILNWKFLFWVLKKLAIGNGKIWENDFEIWMEIWKNEICHENLKWKNWKFSFLNLKIFIFEIWNENFCLIFLKNGHITKWKWKNNWNEEIIYFATEIKLSIIPLYHSYHLCMPPYTTMCRLWWYTINLSRRIFSYWSFSNSGIGWYGPP
jgi:hypothetical protein